LVLLKNLQSISLRTADLADAETLARLGAATFTQAFAEYNTEEDMAEYLASAFSPEKQAIELRNPGTEFLIATSENLPVGYVKLDRSDPPKCVTGAQPLEIVRFYVEAEWHGSGISRILMTEVVRRAAAAGNDILWLGVWERNARAIAFYKKWKFEIVGKKEFLLGSDLQSDFVMTRSVGSS
jgi:diamine N-acetyltransferase